MTTNEETHFICLHPHLLTESTLIYHLEQRFMNIQHLSSMSKEKLVEIFQRVALPLPQRKYRQNHRGKLLTKLRTEREGRKARKEDKKSNISYGFSEPSGSQFQISLGASDRLKPPPDSVNYERRKIRLSSSSSKSSDLDHIQIKRKREEGKNGLVNHVNKPESNGELRRKGSSSDRDKKSSSKSRIVLKRSHSASSKHDDTTSETERKREKKLITWP